MNVIEALSGKLGSPRVSGSQVSFNCPFCRRLGGYVDTKRHLHISLDKNAVHCFRCGFHGTINYLLSRLSIRGVRVSKTSSKQITRPTNGLVVPFDFIFVNSQNRSYLKTHYLDEVRYAVRRGLSKETSGYFGVCRDHVVVFNSVANVSHYYCRDINSKAFSNPSGVPVPVYFIDRVLELRCPTLILAEGPFDAFAWWHGTIMMASAFLGKNISQYQMSQLAECIKAGVTELCIAFDFDAAASIRKAVQLLRTEFPNVKLSFIRLPNGKDADELDPNDRLDLFKQRRSATLSQLILA